MTKRSQVEPPGCSRLGGMPYPNLEDKFRHTALFAPQEFLAYLRAERALHPGVVPESFVVCYAPWLFEHLVATETLIPVGHHNRRFFALERTEGRVGVVGDFGVGAPAATIVLEELAALGVRQVLSIGVAGCLRRDLDIGATVVCTSAIRDEGVSHHYLAPGRTVTPSRGLTSRLEARLQEADVAYTCGPTWTIDTPYRETLEEIRHYQAEGVLTVEMEAAALFAVGQCRSIEVAAGFVISDSLAELVWDPQFRAPATRDGLIELYHIAVQTLSV